jgi:hypothetical protein
MANFINSEKLKALGFKETHSSLKNHYSYQIGYFRFLVASDVGTRQEAIHLQEHKPNKNPNEDVEIINHFTINQFSCNGSTSIGTIKQLITILTGRQF